MRKYEIMYILRANLDEEARKAQMEKAPLYKKQEHKDQSEDAAGQAQSSQKRLVLCGGSAGCVILSAVIRLLRRRIRMASFFLRRKPHKGDAAVSGKPL